MAAGTVSYSDTTGNKDYLGIIAGQIGSRLKQASDMASDERSFAEKKAEDGGTSLSEAGIGRGHFFKRALGSRFGGDRIARTRGRMGASGPGTNPTGNFKTRFRGGFDYNVTNEIQSATAPLSGAVVSGLRGVEGGLTEIGRSINGLAVGMNNLARSQEDVARQSVMNGAFMQAFLNHMQREGARQRARKEESGLERRSRFLGGGGGSGRGMINVTPKGGGGAKSTGGLFRGLDTVQTGVKTATNVKGLKGAQTLAKNASKATGITNLFGTGARGITKAAANQNVVKVLKGSGSKVNAGVLKAVERSGLATAKGGSTATKIALNDKGASRLLEAMRKVDPLAESADDFARGMSNIGMEDTLLKRALGSTGDIPIPKKQAAKTFAGLVDGSLDGTARSTDEALAATRFLFGEDQYKRLMGGADVPIDKAFKGTFSHKMLKAPGVPQAMKSAAKTGLGKTLLKKIPVIAGIAGIVFGIQRALEGDFLGAGLEISSGLMGATGVGSGLSLAIDGYLLGRDMGMIPMAKGGLLTQPTNILAGEAGAEGVFPLEGARGKKTFKMFGEGVLNAQKDNQSDYANLQANGLKRYYEGMGGWAKFLDVFGDIFTSLGDTISNAMYNIFSNIPILKNFVKKPADSTTSSGSGAGRTSMSMNAADIKADTPEEKAFIATVRELEGTAGKGGYSTWFGGRNEMDMTKMTIQQVHDEQTRRMKAGETTYNGQSSAAVGAGQFLTPLAQVKAMFASQGKAFDPTKVKFTEELQNQLMLDLAKRKRGVDVSKPLTLEGMKILGGEWASFTPQHGQTSRTAVESLRAYDENLGEAKKLRPTSSNKGVNLFDLFKSGSNPDGVASALNGQSGMFTMGSQFTIPTTIVNNYNTVAGGGSGDDDSFASGFPSGFSGFIVPYSMDALK